MWNSSNLKTIHYLLICIIQCNERIFLGPYKTLCSINRTGVINIDSNDYHVFMCLVNLIQFRKKPHTGSTPAGPEINHYHFFAYMIRKFEALIIYIRQGEIQYWLTI